MSSHGRIHFLRAFISENAARLKEDWQSVESKRIAHQNIADAAREIEQLEAEIEGDEDNTR